MYQLKGRSGISQLASNLRIHQAINYVYVVNTLLMTLLFRDLTQNFVTNLGEGATQVMAVRIPDTEKSKTRNSSYQEYNAAEKF